MSTDSFGSGPGKRHPQPALLIFIVALWLTLFMNGPFWRQVWDAVGGFENDHPGFLLSLPALVTLFNFVVLCSLAWGKLLRPVLILMLLLSAVVSYFMGSFGILIDYSMVLNILQTDKHEVFDLLGPGLLFWVLLVGLLPAILVSRVRLARARPLRAVAIQFGSLAGALLLIALILALSYQSYASLLRNNRELRLMLVPSNLVGALHSYAERQLRMPSSLETVGLDAVRQVSAADGSGFARDVARPSVERPLGWLAVRLGAVGRCEKGRG